LLIAATTATNVLQLTAAGDDYVHNNIKHEFLSVKQGPPELQAVFRVFTLLMPDSLFTFSAAKYCKVGLLLHFYDLSCLFNVA
jgi:hypothetical protein